MDLSDDHDPGSFDEVLPEAFAIIGQPDLPAERLARATALRAICNVEGNFFPNVDYDGAFARGIQVLGCGPAYAQAVAEYALGLALDVARGISREDRAFRSGTERYVLDGNADAILLRGARVGLIGYGNLGRAAATAAGGVRRRPPGVRPVAARPCPARVGSGAGDAGRACCGGASSSSCWPP